MNKITIKTKTKEWTLLEDLNSPIFIIKSDRKMIDSYFLLLRRIYGYNFDKYQILNLGFLKLK